MTFRRWGQCSEFLQWFHTARWVTGRASEKIEKLPTIFSNFFTPNSEIHTHSIRSTNDLHLSSVNSSLVKCVKFKAKPVVEQLTDQIKAN